MVHLRHLHVARGLKLLLDVLVVLRWTSYSRCVADPWGAAAGRQNTLVRLADVHQVRFPRPAFQRVQLLLRILGFLVELLMGDPERLQLPPQLARLHLPIGSHRLERKAIHVHFLLLLLQIAQFLLRLEEFLSLFRHAFPILDAPNQLLHVMLVRLDLLGYRRFQNLSLFVLFLQQPVQLSRQLVQAAQLLVQGPHHGRAVLLFLLQRLHLVQ
mmetsp:Transcript_5868/g.14596  ORF Transcript_5868/g.14596 Transcript_5868/m.14596 type:complete len:213 (+) Transcript_5868:632-1270(+)